MEPLQFNVEEFFNIMAIFLSINIVFWFSWAIYFNIKRILLYKKIYL